MKISSDLGQAQQKATAISNALSALTSTPNVSLDNQTTVTGNTDAREAIITTKNVGQQISNAVAKATQNLQTVAKGFEAVDQSVKQAMADDIGGLK